MRSVNEDGEALRLRRPEGDAPRLLALGSLLAILSICASVLFLLSGCSAVMSALDIQNPRYALRDVNPRVDIAIPLSASTIDLDLGIDVDNPNSVGLRLDQLDFNVFVNGNRLIDGISSQDVRIPANGTGNVRLRTRIGYQNIRSIWSEVVNVIGGRNANYEVRGTAYYDTPAGRLQFPLTVYSSR